MSQKWQRWWRPHLSPTLRQPECGYNSHKGMCTKISTAPRWWGRHSQSQLFQNSTQGISSPRTCIFRVAVLRTTLPEGTQGVSLCSSLRFNPDMRAERWAGWLKRFQKYTRFPKSANQPHIDTAHSCQQHPVLPSNDLFLCHTRRPQRTQGCLWQVPCTTFRAVQGGEGEAEVIAVGPVLLGSHKT